MIEITKTITSDGFIYCSVNCPQKILCANHESALDMRTETGSRPKLTLQNNTIFCSTFNNDFMKATYGEVTIQQLKG
jgi:hypothetical protein